MHLSLKHTIILLWEMLCDTQAHGKAKLESTSSSLNWLPVLGTLVSCNHFILPGEKEAGNWCGSNRENGHVHDVLPGRKGNASWPLGVQPNSALSPSFPMGPNGIQPRVLQELADVIAAPLSWLLRCFHWAQSFHLTEKWQKFKKGEKEDPGNSRLGSLTSVPGKIREKVILSILGSFSADSSISQLGCIPCLSSKFGEYAQSKDMKQSAPDSRFLPNYPSSQLGTVTQKLSYSNAMILKFYLL